MQNGSGVSDTDSGLAGRHSEEARIDGQAVATLTKMLLESDGVRPDIKDNDKWPNFDGTIEVIQTAKAGEEEGQPIGTFRVQVKGTTETLSDRPSYTLRANKLFNAIRRTGGEIPTLLIVVDLEKELAYWKHLSIPYIQSLEGSRTVHFSDHECIKEGATEHITQWRAIVEEHQEQIEEGKKALVSFSHLRDIAEPHPDLSDEDISAVKAFLEELNTEINTSFRPLKARLIGDASELGFAYSVFEQNELVYALYEIPYEEVDPKIWKLTTSGWEEVIEYTSNITRSSGNPVLDSPRSFAYDVLENRVSRLTDQRGLHHDHSAEFASEFLHSMSHHLGFALDVDPTEEIRVGELRTAVRNYMPIWLAQAVQYVVDNGINGIQTPEQAARPDVAGNPLYFDPEYLYRQIVDEGARREITADATEALEQDNPPLVGPYGHPDYPPRVALECIRALEDRGIEIVEPVLPSRDEWTGEHWHWDEKRWLSFGREFLKLWWNDYPRFVNRNFDGVDSELLPSDTPPGPSLFALGYSDSETLGQSLSVLHVNLKRQDGLEEPDRCIILTPDDLGEWRESNLREQTYTDDEGAEYTVGSAGGWFRLDAGQLNGPVLLDYYYDRLERSLEDWFQERQRASM